MDIKEFAAAKLMDAKQKKWKYRYNLFMMGIIAFFVIGYGFFFTSKFWYHDDSNLATPTQMNSIVTWHQRDVQLLSWTYAPDMNTMELQFQIANKSHDGIESYTYRAYERYKGYLQTEAVIEQDGLYIIYIKGVPKDWSDMAFFIDYPDAEADYCKVLTNDKAVAQVDSIEKHTYNEYRIMNIDNQIAYYNSEIQSLQQDIEDQKVLISEYETNIQKYEAQKIYQTQLEQKTTDRLITEEQSMKSTAEKNIESDNNMILEYQERIVLLNEQKGLYQ